MEKQEFNLSEKINLYKDTQMICGYDDNEIEVKNVKEFIRLLKEEIENDKTWIGSKILFLDFIDKLAGSQLNGMKGG